MKGKALRKHSLHEKTAASVLLKLFITTDAPKTETINMICFSSSYIYACLHVDLRNVIYKHCFYKETQVNSG